MFGDATQFTYPTADNPLPPDRQHSALSFPTDFHAFLIIVLKKKKKAKQPFQ